jgi:hypothetical protein
MKLSNHGVTIHSEFPGGNILVDACDGQQVELRPALRDTKGQWFYWYFEVNVETPRTVRFNFPKDKNSCIGVHGPAVSTDGGKSWDWLSEDRFDASHTWSYHFKQANVPHRFAVCLPYVSENLNQFSKELKPAFDMTEFCISNAGRSVPAWDHSSQSHSPKVIVTARQHACESSGSFVMEGMLNFWAKLPESPSFLAIPFMDMDGVANGDQGKNRQPHDHNRDYQPPHLYSESKALVDYITGLQQTFVLLDLHCPYIKNDINETAYLVGSRIPEMALKQKAFCQQLEHCAAGLPFTADNLFEYGRGWNTASNYLQGKSLSAWTEAQAHCELSVTVEIPYANAEGTRINPDRLRKFGASLAAALQTTMGK